MTDFFTHCCKSVRRNLWLYAALMLAAMCAALNPARASMVELTRLQVERATEALYLTAQVRIELSQAVIEALEKGIAVHFVAEAEISRARWYWYDKGIASVRRYLRVAYQPLTRQWRLNISSQPIVSTHLGVTLTQNYESLSEVMQAVQRITRWRIAELSELDGGGRQSLLFRFRLDASQLPRTLQIGAIGDSAWKLEAERRIDLTQESER